jgi:hypothetical protein
MNSQGGTYRNARQVAGVLPYDGGLEFNGSSTTQARCLVYLPIDNSYKLTDVLAAVQIADLEAFSVLIAKTKGGYAATQFGGTPTVYYNGSMSAHSWKNVVDFGTILDAYLQDSTQGFPLSLVAAAGPGSTWYTDDTMPRVSRGDVISILVVNNNAGDSVARAIQIHIGARPDGD